MPKGKTWTTEELQKEFQVIGFGFGFVAVKRLSDGELGSMDFKHSPRLYHSYRKDR